MPCSAFSRATSAATSWRTRWARAFPSRIRAGTANSSGARLVQTAIIARAAGRGNRADVRAGRAGMDEARPLAVPGATIAGQVLWLSAPILVEQALLYLVGLS